MKIGFAIAGAFLIASLTSAIAQSDGYGGPSTSGGGTTARGGGYVYVPPPPPPPPPPAPPPREDNRTYGSGAGVGVPTVHGCFGNGCWNTGH